MAVGAGLAGRVRRALQSRCSSCSVLLTFLTRVSKIGTPPPLTLFCRKMRRSVRHLVGPGLGESPAAACMLLRLLAGAALAYRLLLSVTEQACLLLPPHPWRVLECLPLACIHMEGEPLGSPCSCQQVVCQNTLALLSPRRPNSKTSANNCLACRYEHFTEASGCVQCADGFFNDTALTHCSEHSICIRLGRLVCGLSRLTSPSCTLLLMTACTLLPALSRHARPMRWDVHHLVSNSRFSHFCVSRVHGCMRRLCCKPTLCSMAACMRAPGIDLCVVSQIGDAAAGPRWLHGHRDRNPSHNTYPVVQHRRRKQLHLMCKQQLRGDIKVFVPPWDVFGHKLWPVQ
jgi:hypothetical protein